MGVPDDGMSVQDRRAQRRRAEDQQLLEEVSAFTRNKITRRLALVASALLSAAAATAYHRYNNIPSVAWQRQVTENQENAKRTYEQMQLKLSMLEQKVEIKDQVSAEEREQIRQEIRDLRLDLQRWFREASR